jgi:hypothetical protein
MFKDIDYIRILSMTDQEKRWFDNVKKAFYDSDVAMQSGIAEDKCLEELFKGIDTAKTLRRSLRGEDVSSRDNKKRFIEFLALTVPAFRPDMRKIELRLRNTGELRPYTLGEIVYAIRCMVHENENLNAKEDVDYHILLDWSARNPQFFAELKDGQYVINGFFQWERLRQMLSTFITIIQSKIDFAEKGTFSISISPDIGSIKPQRRM